ncbi:FG-GAP-like repeat-containing protein [Paenarthrobacter sp. NyZ202]|uniref:FG-GAP-like repeat-containing protein n=1 Tax=Paenarthrobacter sp. NyZ202 TaxID=3402689 RepID=UPI003CEE6B21
MALGTTSAPAHADVVVDRFPIPQWITDIAVNPVTDTVFVASGIEGVIRHGAGGTKKIYPEVGERIRLAVNSVTNKLYINNSYGAVVAFDDATGASTEIALDATPTAIAVNEKTNKVYVGTTTGLVVIDGRTNAVTPVPGATSTREIVVNTVTNTAYALSSGAVKVIDSLGKITSTVSIGAGGFLAMALNPTSNKLYVTTAPQYGSSLKVIDGASNTITGTVASNDPLGALAVNPVTDKVYIGSGNDANSSIKVVDGPTMTESAIVPIATPANTIVVNPTNNKVYATMAVRGATIIDGRDNSSTVLYTGWDPGKAAVNPRNNKVYVVNTAKSGFQVKQFTVAVIDGNAKKPAKNDFNGDGKADVLARDASGLLWLYPGNGTGGWLPRVQVGQGWNVMTAMVTPGDFNADGHADLLGRDGGGLLWFYPGNGAGGWKPRVQVGHDWQTMNSLLALDYYGDGYLDLIARTTSGSLQQYVADGKSRFLHPGWAGGGLYSAAGLTELTGVEDFNADGLGDMVARDSAGVLWLHGATGFGSWLPKQQIGQGWNAMNSLVGPGDFNGDGKADILARDAAGNLWLYSNNGVRTWPSAIKVGTGWNVMTEIL